MSFKSVLIGYLRAISFLAFAIASLFLIMEINGNSRNASTGTPARMLANGQYIPPTSASSGLMSPAVKYFTIMALSLFFLFGSRYVPGIGKASASRFQQIGRLIGMTDADLDAIRQRHFKLPPVSGFEVLQPTSTNQPPASQPASTSEFR